MDIKVFGDRLVGLLPELMQEISRYEHNYVTKGTITCQQLAMLNLIDSRKEWLMKDLTCEMQVAFSAVTAMVDRLLKLGLVRRFHGKEDRRTVLVSVSAKGKRILNEIFTQKKEGLMQVFGHLSQSERKAYLDILEKLVKHLSDAKEYKREK